MKVLIVDDEHLARARLRSMVEELGAGEVVGEAANGRDALRVAQETGADLVLLDIRMPDMDGIEVARHLCSLEQPPAVVFTTAYDSHALEAIEANAVAYLLKPVRQIRLAEAISRAKTLTRVQIQSLSNEDADVARTHISATLHGGLTLLPVSEVRYFRAEHKYVTARHCAGELVIEDSLASLEKEFGEQFLRVHRNALAAVGHMRGLHRRRGDRLVVVFAGVEDELEVSRRLASQVRRVLKSMASGSATGPEGG